MHAILMEETATLSYEGIYRKFFVEYHGNKAKSRHFLEVSASRGWMGLLSKSDLLSSVGHVTGLSGAHS